ncbi:MAG TPA: class I tRNA ligase family protein, partial [Terriglobales bacterium]
GADATRMYTLFAAPPDRDLDWQDAGVEGIARFLARVYRFVAAPYPTAPDAQPADRAVMRKLHNTIRRITDDFNGRWHFNTSIAALMELLNLLYEFRSAPGVEEEKRAWISKPVLREVQRKFVLLLHPFAPFLSHELWEMLGEKGSLLRHPWPQYDAALAREEEIEIVVQVNGKIRARLMVGADAGEEDVRQLALNDPKVLSSLDGKKILKAIVVPHKLVNIVVK